MVEGLHVIGKRLLQLMNESSMWGTLGDVFKYKVKNLRVGFKVGVRTTNQGPTALH
jgi:hypothetical protein